MLDGIAPVALTGRTAEGQNLDGVLLTGGQPGKENVLTIAGKHTRQPGRSAVGAGPAFVHFGILDRPDSGDEFAGAAVGRGDHGFAWKSP